MARNSGIAATGFHSSAHLLAILRLGRKYVACFFGDNYPIPHPNELYMSLVTEGAVRNWITSFAGDAEHFAGYAKKLQELEKK